MENKAKSGFFKRPILTGAAAFALAFGAFGAGHILQPGLTQAGAIQAKAPKAAASLPGFADLVENVSPAVVAIDVTAKTNIEDQLKALPKGLDPEFKKFFEEQFGKSKEKEVKGGGSGFFISDKGYIVTNNHVVENATNITVTLHDGRELEAKVIGTDARTDLAVLKVEGSGFQFVEFDPSTKIRVGDWVVAIGNPFGLGGTATAGIVSGLGRENVGEANISDFIQIDAPINPGNSGGPTFDMNGRVIGVNTAIFSRSGGNIGIGFAIPSNIARTITDQLIKNGQVKYGWLGAVVQDLNRDMADSYGLKGAKGALISSITPNSPAQKAGLKRGDVVLSIDGKVVNSNSDLTRKIGQTPAGSKIVLEVADQSGKKRPIEVLIAERPSEKQLADLLSKTDIKENAKVEATEIMGFMVGPLTQAARTKLKLAPEDKGVLVTSIDEDSKAFEVGISVGDAILEINGKEVVSTDQFKSEIEAAKKDNRKSVRLYVQSSESQGGGFVLVPF